MHLTYINDLDSPLFGYCDLDFENGNDLYDAVHISLLSYARGIPDDDQTSPPRYGWWIDDLTGYTTGSKIWTLRRAKITLKTLPQIKQYLWEALEWLIYDGIAANMIIDVEQTGDTVAANIQIIRSSGDTVNISYDDLWKQLQ